MVSFSKVFAPGLADGVSSRMAVGICWILLQTMILFSPLWIRNVGNPTSKVFNIEVNYWPSLVSAAIEVIVSEAWIEKAKSESKTFKVPSWMEIALEMERNERDLQVVEPFDGENSAIPKASSS